MPINLRIIDPSEFIALAHEGNFDKKESIDLLSKIVIEWLAHSSQVI